MVAGFKGSIGGQKCAVCQKYDSHSSAADSQVPFIMKMNMCRRAFLASWLNLQTFRCKFWGKETERMRQNLSICQLIHRWKSVSKLYIKYYADCEEVSSNWKMESWTLIDSIECWWRTAIPRRTVTFQCIGKNWLECYKGKVKVAEKRALY